MNKHAEALKYALQVLNNERYKKYIKAIYLYGSCARGEQKATSDVDLFLKVDIDTPQKVLLSMRNDVMPEDEFLPEVELKFSKSDQFSSCNQFSKNIERDGKLLWERV